MPVGISSKHPDEVRMRRLYFILDFGAHLKKVLTMAYILDTSDAAMQVLISAEKHVRGDLFWPSEIRISAQETLAKAESKIYV
jgi:hypothetical protein